MSLRLHVRPAALLLTGFAALMLISPLVTAEDIDLGAKVPSRRPKTAAKILRPSNGQHFSKALVTVSGTCPNKAIVEIYKNAIFAGSTYCTSDVFSLQISLVPGRNVLIAKVRDEVDQYGPNSSAVVVFYDTNGGLSALIVTTDAVYRGGKVNIPMPIKIRVYGGRSPYALSIDWESGQRDLISRATSAPFIQSHAYHQPGSYEIKIQAVDHAQQKAFVQTVAIIDGQVTQTNRTPADAITKRSLLSTPLNLMGILSLAAVAFWGGHKYAQRRRQNKAVKRMD